MIPAHWRRPFTSPFPNVAQIQVLRAIFAPEPEARRAFDTWRSGVDPGGDFDPALQRLLPLLYMRLCELGIDDDVLLLLKGVYYRAWLRNAELFHDMGKALSALARADIPTLLLKGAALALVSYSKPAARPMGDFDVAVPKECAADAIHLLQTEGWTSQRINLKNRSVYHATPFKNERGNELDLHWNILTETAGKRVEARFWETARPLSFNGVPTRMLDPALALVHALVHGLRTNPVSPVRWVADALTLVRRTTDLDWDLLAEFASAAQVTQRTHLGLAFINQHFDAPIPTDTLNALAASRHGLVERAETAAVLFETRGLGSNAISKPIILLTDYLRRSDESGLQRVRGFVRYVHRRLVLNSGL